MSERQDWTDAQPAEVLAAARRVILDAAKGRRFVTAMTVRCRRQRHVVAEVRALCTDGQVRARLWFPHAAETGASAGRPVTGEASIPLAYDLGARIAGCGGCITPRWVSNVWVLEQLAAGCREALID